MFRFGTKSLLFVFVLTALWLSTFSGYAAGHDVRASVLLIVLLTAGFAAIYSAAARRAFWTGFFVVMLLCGGNLFQGPANKYVPMFQWRWQVMVPAAPVNLPPPAGFGTYSSPSAGSPSPQPTLVYSYSTIGPTAAAAPSMGNQEFVMAVHATIEMAWVLALAAIVGFVGVWLYQSSRPKRDNAALE